LSEELVKIPKR